MLWICADQVLDGEVDPGTEVCVGLRGGLLYGGLAIGKLGSDPSETQNDSSVDRDNFFRFFKDDAVSPPSVDPAENETDTGDATDDADPSEDETADSADLPAADSDTDSATEAEADE